MSDTENTTWSARAGAACGVAWIGLILVGNSLTEAGAPADRTPDSSIEYLRLQAGGSQELGIGLELLGFTLMAFFLGRLYSVLRSAEPVDGWLANVALIGGAVTLAVKIGSASSYLVAKANVETLSPELAGVLLDLGDAAFLVTALTSGILVLASALSALSSGVLPRWLSWAGVPAGVLAIGGSLQPFALDGGPGVGGFLLGLLWLAAVSVKLAVRPGRVTRHAGRGTIAAAA